MDTYQEHKLTDYREFRRSNTPDHELQSLLEDPAGKVDDLTGYPAARGCKQCRKHEQSCSMVKGSIYPCQECTEDGIECQPIQEPTVIGRCKQCDTSEEDFCSFEDDPTQTICDHCADNDHICEALPPDGYKAKRIDLDEIAYGPNRLYIACTACRRDKRRCSLKGKQEKPPCKYCKKNNIGCTFYDIPKLEIQKQTANKKTLLEEIAPEVVHPNSGFFTAKDLADMDRRNDNILSREPTPEIEMEDTEGNKGILTKIKTSFAHPIRFSVAIDANSNCNFCELPVYGMVGHMEREVHVIQWDTGLGYSEVGGGHCGDNGATTMCEECTNRRLQIIVCPGHQFERMTYESLENDVLTDALLSAEIGSLEMQYQLQRWCSLCFSPAVFGCNVVQPGLLGDEESEVTGCGLRLCHDCEMALQKDFNGDFDRIVEFLDKQPKVSEADEMSGDVEGRPRADVGFLKQDSLLVRSQDFD
jgi:hypothetical protein